ncbi:hypothetical protein V8E51_018982 [Hyaloscypha variabilis]
MPHSLEPQLYVNDGPLSPASIAPLLPSSPDLPLADLRERFNANGYLFLKGLLPRADVLKARENYFKFLSPSGVLKPGSEPVLGIFDAQKDISLFPGIGAGAAGANTDPGQETTDFVQLALEAHAEPWYADEFCKHPVLMEFMEKFTGWEEKTLPFRRTLLRNNIPGAQAIGVHYDQIFLRYGEPTSVTVWVPMGDISLQGGGLIYLENGHDLGREFEEKFTAKAKASGLREEEAKSAFNKNMLSSGLLAEGPAEFGLMHNRHWLVSAYDAGDVVLHSPYMIHASTVNQDPNNIIRLATDLRFVDSSKQWDQVCQN